MYVYIHICIPYRTMMGSCAEIQPLLPFRIWEVGGMWLETSSSMSAPRSISSARCLVFGMTNRGVRFHRIRDFKQYCFNGIPPTSQYGLPSLRARGPWAKIIVDNVVASCCMLLLCVCVVYVLLSMLCLNYVWEQRSWWTPGVWAARREDPTSSVYMYMYVYIYIHIYVYTHT